MRPIRRTSTLVYYDGVQVFEGRDAIGGHYIGVMIASSGDSDRYLVAGVVPEKLRLFRTGELDLRALFLEAGHGEWILADSADGLETPVTPVRPESSDVRTQWLPDDGFFLHDRPGDDLALREARERHNTVLEVRMEPPEAAEEHRIRAETLGDLLHNMQKFVKYAYRKVVPNPRERKHDGHLMDVVVPASPGSFRVVFAAAGGSDLFGFDELAKSLEKMDAVFASGVDPKRARERMTVHSGHLAKSYIDLMGFLSKIDSGMRYAWAAPEFDSPKCGSVSKGMAAALFKELSKSENLGTERVEIVGDLHMVNRRSGSWGLETEDGIRSGKIRGDSYSLTTGLVVGKRYKFSCFEEIERSYVSGQEKEQSTLYLNNIGPA